MARTFNESKAVFLAGPIEFWWDTEEEPHKFYSHEARAYREHRDNVRDFFVNHGFLVYSPHSAFKGDWNEKMQPVNDYVLGLCDIVVDLTPAYFTERTSGTEHEVQNAYWDDKVVLHIPDQETLDWVGRSMLHLL